MTFGWICEGPPRQNHPSALPPGVATGRILCRSRVKFA
jgi:hypothetical protein